MLFLSIIIPAYNSEKTIILLLSSIAASRKVDLKKIEVIVVDDASTDETVDELRTQNSKLKSLQDKKYRLRIEELKKNQGPAAARNIGVKYARGKVVLFLDADVVLYKNTLFEIIKSFEHDKDLFAMTGVWDKRQRSHDFFPKFKALRDWSYWINERDPKNYYYLFSTRIAAINRGLFLRLGGFDITYKHALIEDIELTYRIAKRYAVVFNPKAKVTHEFENFWIVAKKYFWRSYYWSRIYRERKKFDPVATTGKEAVTTISAGGLVGGIILLGGIRLIGQIGPMGQLGELEKLFFVLCSLFFVVHLFGVRKFLWFVYREEGIVFALKSFVTGIVLYIVILSGAGWSMLKIRDLLRD